MTIAETEARWQEAREETLPRGAPVNPLENAWALKATALDHIRQLAGKVWTDHNIHDPGIAILDLLCFAVSDLGYRMSFPVEDLLASEETEDGRTKPPQFFTAREILTSDPVTALDFRKYLIDTPGVKNAWIRPAPAQEQALYLDRQAEALSYQIPTQGSAQDAVTLGGLNALYLELDQQPDVADDLNDNVLTASLALTIGGGTRDLTLDLDVGFSSLFDPASLNPARPDLFNLKSLPLAARRPYVAYSANWTPGQVDWLFKTADTVTVQGVRPVFAWLERDLIVPVTLAFSVGGEIKHAGLCLHLVHDGRINLGAKDNRETIEATVKRAGFAWLNTLVARHRAKVERRLSITETALARLHGKRALCEDYATIFGMKIEEVALCADIELDPGADPDRVYSDIRHQIEQFLAPDIRFRSLEDLLDRGIDPTAIFNGPALDHGFLDPESLRKSVRIDVINTSDIINILMDIDGIIAVRDLMLSSYVDNDVRVANARWSLTLSPDTRHVARLGRAKSAFNFFKGHVPCAVDHAAADALYQEARAKEDRQRLAEDKYDILPPQGVPRDLGRYTSVQTHFPLNFGIGYEGLAASESPERKAQAAQLKAYLMFFDQILANYLAQLSKVKDLLSVNNDVSASFFVSPVYDAPDIAPLIRDFITGPAAGLDPADKDGMAAAWARYVTSTEASGYQSRLEQISDLETAFYGRHNRVLDHLLARFAEQFTDYALLLYDLEGRRRADKELLVTKSAFLKDYPPISRGRGGGFDYQNPAQHWTPGNVAGLARRVSRLMGFDSSHARTVAPLPGGEATFREQAGAWHFTLTVPASVAGPALEINAIQPAANEADARRLYLDFLRIVTEDVSAHATEEGEDQYALIFSDLAGAPLARAATIFASEEAARSALARVIDFVDETYFLEGLHVLEHILLRPLTGEEALLPVTVPEGCSATPEVADPYSFRASVVLPALAARFRNRDMRALVENTLRLEAPAHVYIKICWIDHAQMIAFEAALKDWMAAKTGLHPDPETLRQKQDALIGVLDDLRSIYPVATLHDCDDPSESLNPVVLNHTAIGIFSEDGLEQNDTPPGPDADGD